MDRSLYDHGGAFYYSNLNMLILKNKTAAETWAKNSRFLGEAFPVSSPEDAKDKWKFRKQTYDNGGHIVYAFAVGPQQNILGCSDDGEPSGTAGRPVLAVLKGSNITNIMITVARWFGGTKLGTGGLVHAYTEAAQAALQNVETVELVPVTALSFDVTYPLYEQVKRKFAEYGFAVTEEIFGALIQIRGEIRTSAVEDLKKALIELSDGRIKIV